MNDIRSFIIINRKTKFVTKIFILITILITITLIIISNFKYQKFIKIDSQVIKNDNIYQLSIYLCPEQLNIIKNNNNLFINDIEYPYNIDFISDEYFVLDDYKKYLNVVLNIELDNKDKIENNLLKIKVLESNKKLFYYLKKYFIKGE